MNVTTTYLGLVDGMHTYEVQDDSGTMIGKNQSPYPPCPGPGWVLDENTCTWVEQA